MVVVAKFGGTSTRDGPRLEHIVDNIILRDPNRRVIVVSAPAGVTDLLIEIGKHYHSSRQYSTELVRQVQDRFLSSAQYLGLGPVVDPFFEQLKKAIKDWNPNEDMYMDQIKPIGEKANAELMAALIRKKGRNAKVYRQEDIGMYGEGQHGNAILTEDSYGNIARHLKPVLTGSDEIIVLAGYYVISRTVKLMTYYRNGNDVIAAQVTNALDADLNENWTDTNGILSADPRIISNPLPIRHLIYGEATQLASAGAKVLHEDTLSPLEEKAIPLRVRNTENLEDDGTLISAYKPPNGRIVEGIALKEGYTLVYIDRMGVNTDGSAVQIRDLFKRNGFTVEQDQSGPHSYTLAVVTNGRIEDIRRLKERIVQKNLAKADQVELDEDYSLICIVGEGMRHTPGIYRSVGNALELNGINVPLDFQSPRSIVLPVKASDARKAYEALYNLHFSKAA